MLEIIKNKNLDNRWRTRNETIYLIFHHAKSIKCTIEDIDRWHRENGWYGIGYNYFINKKGEVFEGRPLHIEGSHTKGYNNSSIGVCFEGNFELEKETPEQKKAAIQLCKLIKKMYNNIRIMRHSDFFDTTCPANLDLLGILKELEPEQKKTELQELKEQNENLKKQLDRIINILERRLK